MKKLIALLLVPLSALAEDKLSIADSSSSGTYHDMIAEVKEVCSVEGEFVIEEAPQKGGATDNLDLLINNKVSAAVLHSDVIYAMAQADGRYRELKTLVSFYPEDIHPIALRNSKTKVEGKHFYNKDQSVEFNSLADLKGFKVGAAGGGCISARVLTGQGEGHFDVTCFDSGKELLPALDNGQVDTILFVGGAPLKNIEALDGAKYKLLPINESFATKTSGIYKQTSINYLNLKSGTVKTLAPMAIVLTRKYTVPKLIAPQAKFRQCFYTHLEELQQTPGKHPKWQSVEPEAVASEKSVWEWYQLPTAPAPTTPPKTATKKAKRS